VCEAARLRILLDQNDVRKLRKTALISDKEKEKKKKNWMQKKWRRQFCMPLLELNRRRRRDKVLNYT
jgi:hypothetical protein